jgi:hypothetical protein
MPVAKENMVMDISKNLKILSQLLDEYLEFNKPQLRSDLPFVRQFLKKYNQLVPPPIEIDILNNLIFTIKADGSLPSIEQRPFLVRRHLFMQLCFGVGLIPYISCVKVFEFYNLNFENI